MFVGIDIGTQSLKAVVADAAMRVRGSASRAYQPSFPRAGWAEQDVRLWEAAIGPAIADALGRADVPASQVAAIGVGGQLDGCIPVDADGKALSPCIMWMDRRATDELAGLPHDFIHASTGLVPDASHMAAKIRWLKRQAGMGAAKRFHQPVSYMVERLTGEAVLDHALASTTMFYSLAGRRYDPALLELFGVEADELPRIACSFDRAGTLSVSGAELTGLPAGICVAVGTGDDFSTPLGAGLCEPGQVAVVLGTGEVVGAIHSSPLVDAERLVETHGYPSGGWFLENPGWFSGGAVAWLMGILEIDDVAAFDALAASAPPGSDGVLFIPALMGAMAPQWIATARGCFYGLTPAHGRAHMARAVLEGCAFAMRDVVDRLRVMGVATDGLMLLAGGAQSRLWTQMRADLTGLPATLPRHSETAAIGAAMLAAVAAGAAKDLHELAAALEKPAETILPARDGGIVLDDAYGRYRRLFDALRPVFSEVPPPTANHPEH